MKAILNILIIALILTSIKAEVQFGSKVITKDSYQYGQEATIQFNIPFDSEFQTMPKFAWTVCEQMSPNYNKYNEKSLDFQPINTEVTTQGFLIQFSCSNCDYIGRFGVMWVAYTDGGQNQLQLADAITMTPTTNSSPVTDKDFQFSLRCENSNVEVYPLLQGSSQCSYGTRFEYQVLNVRATHDSSTGMVTGSHDFTYQMECGSTDSRTVTIAFLYGCANNLYITRKSVKPEFQHYTNYVPIGKTYQDINTVGILSQFYSVSKTDGSYSYKAWTTHSGNAIQTQITETDVKGGFGYLYSPKTESEGKLLQAIVQVSECGYNCGSCVKGVCLECKEGLIVDKTTGYCVDPSYHTYYYIDGNNVTKVIGEQKQQKPGTGYFVKQLTDCSYTYNFNGTLINSQDDTNEEQWIWITASLTRIITISEDFGYWVDDKVTPDRYWIPPAFDPENPVIRWDIWKWVLDWLLEGYSSETYNDKISEEDFTKKCIEQKWMYSTEEITYVFDHISKQDHDSSSMTYGDVLRTLLQIEYGSYSSRIIGDCSGNGYTASDSVVGDSTTNVTSSDVD